MKIGIHTIHADNNYGAMLQAFATQFAIKRIGLQSEIVNLYPVELENRNRYIFPSNSIKNILLNIISTLTPSIRRKALLFSVFHESLNLSKRYFSIDDIYKERPLYDINLVGSDQVWNVEKGYPKKALMFLDFLPENAVKVSYASSMGNANISDDLLPQLKDALSKFERISVREADAQALISQKLGLTCVQSLDPTFLLTAEEWSLITNPEPLIKGKYILYYGFDKSDEGKKILNTVKNEFKIPIVAISSTIRVPYDVDIFKQDAGPREFVNLFKNASYVVTSSFHGMAFAIHFRKQFIVIKSGTRMSRMESVLDKFSIHDRIVTNKNEAMNAISNNIDYKVSEHLILSSVEESKSYLKSIVSR